MKTSLGTFSDFLVEKNRIGSRHQHANINSISVALSRLDVNNCDLQITKFKFFDTTIYLKIENKQCYS